MGAEVEIFHPATDTEQQRAARKRALQVNYFALFNIPCNLLKAANTGFFLCLGLQGRPKVCSVLVVVHEPPCLLLVHFMITLSILK